MKPTRELSGTAQRQKPPWPSLLTVCPRAASESSLVQRSWRQRLKAKSLLTLLGASRAKRLRSGGQLPPPTACPCDACTNPRAEQSVATGLTGRDREQNRHCRGLSKNLRSKDVFAK